MSIGRRIGKEVQILTDYENVIIDQNHTLMKGDFYKRFRKKLIEIKKSLKVFKIEFNNLENDSIFLTLFVNNKTFNTRITINNYPFKTPFLYINSKEYCPCLNEGELKSLGLPIKCMCQYSILCSGNWRGTNSFIDIIKEFIEYTQLLQRLEDKYNIKIYFVYKKLGFYLPLSHYL